MRRGDRATAWGVRAAMALLLATAAPAQADLWHRAGEWLDLSWNTRFTESYDDNVFNSTTDRESDLVTEVRLDARLAVRHPLGEFNLYYRFNQELYLRHGELNDVGDLAGLGQTQAISFGDAVRLTPRDLLSYSEAFSRTPDTLVLTGSERAAARPPVDVEGVVVGRQGVIQNTTTLGYRHDFRVPLTFSLSGSYRLYEYDDPRRIDNRVANVGADLSWRLSTVRSAGLHLGRSLTEFDDRDSTTSDVVSIVYADQPLPTWSISLSLGASFNSTPDNAVDTVTPDAEVRLGHTFHRGTASLGYRRSVASSAGFGGASENEALNVGLEYRHSPIWSSRLSATLSQRRSQDPETGDTRRVVVRYDTSYPLTRRLQLTAGYLHSNQRQTGRIDAGNVINNRVYVGLRLGADLL